jgi:predicted lactoylglutathione lyase
MPVDSLARSRTFFEALGYHFNPQFSNENTWCLVISETIFAMVLEHEPFAGFAARPISDTHGASPATLSLSATSREAIDEIVAKAGEAGATVDPEISDRGDMYSRQFIDLDGHVWTYMWMDPAVIEAH